jgi:hypothetical protein
MSTLIKPGTYRAKPVAHTISEPKEGRADQIAIRFEFAYDDGKRELTWFGSLHENALKHTLNAIENCGFKYGSLADFLRPDAIDYTREVDIVVEHNTYNGKTSARVTWVNRPGGIELKSMAPEVARNRLASYDILLREHRKSAGMSKPAGPRQDPDDPGFDPNFDLEG